MSAITIQKILNDKSQGTRHERWLALERQNAEQAIELSPEQGRRPWETVELFVSQSPARQGG